VEDGEALMTRRDLMNENNEPIQRRRLFHTRCKWKGKVCKVIIDGGSTDNIVSTNMVEKL